MAAPGNSEAVRDYVSHVALYRQDFRHRYVARGFQLDALCGSYQQLEVPLAERFFDIYSPGRAVPAIIAWG
jgi:hypothetical protein